MNLLSQYMASRHDPHHILGLHVHAGRSSIRLFRPGASDVVVRVFGTTVTMQALGDGFFEYCLDQEILPRDYQVLYNGQFEHDPYAFASTWSSDDIALFASGKHYTLYKMLGGRVKYHQGVRGVAHTVWAPGARSVKLLCELNHWDDTLPMRAIGGGLWELFVPAMDVGDLYKFAIEDSSGHICIKTDPCGLQFECRPKTAAVVVDPYAYTWKDSAWMARRKEISLNRPMAIYEVHLGSWKKDQCKWLTYEQYSLALSEYCIEHGFTHVELLPLAEHPLDESWGYQGTGYFAPTSRFGTCNEFQAFVDILHQHNIGVIMDWVPGHFPKDDFGLARFCGHALYEHEDPRQGMHPHWGTYIFNFGRYEVSNFLLASALSWLDFFHIDGLRVDAVASMLYLDYGRSDGEWIPNIYGGNENCEAIDFLRHVNYVVHDRFPGVLTIAEESSAFPKVTFPVAEGGLGFDMKWNMGWMNDTLAYFQKDPIYRSYHHQLLTFGIMYAFSEKFALVLSHDEVVHGKKSLLSKMPGDSWQQYANLRLLYSYMVCQPGKKLLFMGAELGQRHEWNCTHQIAWDCIEDDERHQQIQRYVKNLLHFYQCSEPLWAADFSYDGFEWISLHDHANSIIAYLRKVPQTGQALLCVHNFTPTYFETYHLTVPHACGLQEVFNSDDRQYGGSGKIFGAVTHEKETWSISIPPLATIIYQVAY